MNRLINLITLVILIASLGYTSYGQEYQVATFEDKDLTLLMDGSLRGVGQIPPQKRSPYEQKWSFDVTGDTDLLALIDSNVESVLEKRCLSENPYVFQTFEEAEFEVYAPRPVAIPTNEDIVLRFAALRGAGAFKRFHRGMYFNDLTRNYNRILNYLADSSSQNALIQSIDIANSQPPSCLRLGNTTFKSLAWKVSVPGQPCVAESISLNVMIENTSQKDVEIRQCELDTVSFCLNSIMIVRTDNRNSVMLTYAGADKYFRTGYLTNNSDDRVVVLHPGERYTFIKDNLMLAKYYDLSEPGEYELTFYTRRFIDENGYPAEDQELEYPRKATVKFTVLPKSEDKTSRAE